MRRWCEHIQPEQLTKTRYFGGWCSRKRTQYQARCRELLGLSLDAETEQAETEQAETDQAETDQAATDQSEDCHDSADPVSPAGPDDDSSLQ